MNFWNPILHNFCSVLVVFGGAKIEYYKNHNLLPHLLINFGVIAQKYELQKMFDNFLGAVNPFNYRSNWTMCSEMRRISSIAVVRMTGKIRTPWQLIRTWNDLNDHVGGGEPRTNNRTRRTPGNYEPETINCATKNIHPLLNRTRNVARGALRSAACKGKVNPYGNNKRQLKGIAAHKNILKRCIVGSYEQFLSVLFASVQ